MTSTEQCARPELLPLADALGQELPTQPCHVYRIDVGGESYVGMTTLTPEQALDNHIEQAKQGDSSKLHKALRRFGYVCGVQRISSHDNEVECLVSKVGQIKRTQPTLNSTFGGEGFNFNLVEMPNHLGEMILFVEDKSLKRRLQLQAQKCSRRHYENLAAKIRARYDKWEDRLPERRAASARRVWPIEDPQLSPPSFPQERQTADHLDLVPLLRHRLQPMRTINAGSAPPSAPHLSQARQHPSVLAWRAVSANYLSRRKERYALMKAWSPDTQQAVHDHEKLMDFVSSHALKLRHKSPKVITEESRRLKSGTHKWTPNYVEDEFNAAAFPGAKRVLTFEDSTFEPQQMFKDQEALKSWFTRQPWLREAILNGILRPGDALQGFKLHLGQYGGFLGLFTKDNYKLTHVLIDQDLIDHIRGVSHLR